MALAPGSPAIAHRSLSRQAGGLRPAARIVQAATGLAACPPARLSDYERACYRAVGEVVSHALEATGRTVHKGESEREVAGQLAHRVLHRGATPVLIHVAADGRGRFYRRGGFTSSPVTQSCVLTLAARKYGLVAQASRTIVFGAGADAYAATTTPPARSAPPTLPVAGPTQFPRQILASGQRIFALTGNEHEWLLAPQGHVTGRCAVERTMTPTTE